MLIHQLIKKIFSSLAIRVIGAGLWFFIFVYLSHMLTEKDFGIFSYIFYVIPIFSAIANFGFSSSIIKYGQKYSHDNKADFMSGFIVLSVFVVCGIGILEIVFLHVFSFLIEESELQKYMFYICSTAVIYALLQIFQSYFRSKMNVFASQFYEQILIPSLFFLFCYIISSVLKIKYILIIYQFLYVFVSIYIFYLLKNRVFKKNKKMKFDYKKWLKSTSKIYVLGIVVLILSRLDIIFLGSIENGDEYLGKYSAIFRIANLIFLIQSGLNMIAEPIMLREQSIISFKKHIKILTTAYMLISLLFLAVVFLFQGWMLKMFHQYSSDLFPILIIVCFGQSMNILNGFHMSIIYKLDLNVLLTRIIFVVIITMFFSYNFFLQKFGLLGVAFVGASGTFLINLFSFFLIIKNIETKVSSKTGTL